MSRITRDRIEPGDDLLSTDLNNRYNDFNQTDINADNAASPSFDHKQMPAGSVLIAAVQGDVGVDDISHPTTGGDQPGSVSITTSAPATPVAVGNILGQTTVATSGSGWVLSAGTLLRVYFNLQCKSELDSGTPPDPHDWPNKMGAFWFDQTISGTTNVNIGAHCWLVQLQWNLTSSALLATDFVAVPGQGDFQSTWSTTGKRGEPVSNLAGTAAVPLLWAGSIGWSEGRAAASTRQVRANGWRNLSGSWVYSGAGQTVYGFRLVVHGVYHPYNNGTYGVAGNDNGLVLETGFPSGCAAFRYSLGNILAMHMRAD